MRKLVTAALVALSLAALAQTAPAATEQARWFVLRDHQIAACWIAILVKVDGGYRHGFAQTAGGPYDTEEQATARRKALQESGTCAQ